jgi:hypothetical protein
MKNFSCSLDDLGLVSSGSDSDGISFVSSGDQYPFSCVVTAERTRYRTL